MEESPNLSAPAGRDSRLSGKGATIRKPNNTLVFILFTGLILLLIAAASLLAAYFFLQREPALPSGWVSPVGSVNRAAIAPDLAVLPLAGEADDRVARAALGAGELETAYATLAYSALLPDTVRSGHWLLLAERYDANRKAGGGQQPAGSPSDSERLAVAYQVVLDQAALSPSLTDMNRAELSLQAARGLAAVGKNEIARLALTQAENIARFSVTLLPAQRRDTLEQVASAYGAMGNQQSAAALRVQIPAASAGPGIRLAPSADVLSELRGSVVLPAAVVTAIQARQQAAANLAARWLNADDAGRADLAAALGDALTAEDTARADFYTTQSSLPAADQLAMMHDRVAWLTLKYRVARGDFNTSLVSDWDSRADEIGSELSAAYTDLINAYGRQLDTLDAAASTQGSMQLLQQALLWVRLGLFPDQAAAEPKLRDQLVDVSQQMWTRRGGAGLVVVAQDVQGETYYLMAGSSTK